MNRQLLWVESLREVAQLANLAWKPLALGIQLNVEELTCLCQKLLFDEPVGRDVEISSQASPSIAPETPDDDNIFLDVDIPQEEEFKERTKRKHDGELDDVEKEVKRERVVEVENDPQLGLFWEDTVEPLDTVLQLHCSISEFRRRTLQSWLRACRRLSLSQVLIMRSRLVELGRGKSILFGSHTTAVDDSTLAEVDVDLVF